MVSCFCGNVVISWDIVCGMLLGILCSEDVVGFFCSYVGVG